MHGAKMQTTNGSKLKGACDGIQLRKIRIANQHNRNDNESVDSIDSYCHYRIGITNGGCAIIQSTHRASPSQSYVQLHHALRTFTLAIILPIAIHRISTHRN